MSKLKPISVVKFVIFSLIGILFFFVPVIPTASGKSTLLVESVNFGKKLLGAYLPVLVLAAVFLLIVLCLLAKMGDRFPTIKKYYGSVKVYSIVLYVIGEIMGLMVYLKKGPEILLSAGVGGTGLGLAGTVIVTIILAGIMVPFLAEFGLLEFVGSIIEPLMRPLFRVPGCASIDAVTSFVANPTVGIFFTNKLYCEKTYTAREAAAIATNFSFISLGYFAIMADAANIMDHYGAVVLTSFVMSFVMAFIMIRIPPIAWIKDEYIDGTQKRVEEKARVQAEGNFLLRSFCQGAAKAESVNTGATFKRYLVDVLIFAQKIPAYILCISTLTLLLAETTPIFSYIGIPFVPVLNLLQIPNAADIAPAIILGLAEVALPAAYIAPLAVPAASAFFVVVVTALQILMFSNSIVSILESDIPLGVGRLLIIFFLRTLIAMPFVAIVTHILF